VLSRATHRPHIGLYIAISPPLGHHHSLLLYQYTPILSAQASSGLDMCVRILPSVVLEQTKDPMQWTSVPKEAPPPLVSSTREDLMTVGFNSALTGLMDFH
jgi:hypothetical protein